MGKYAEQVKTLYVALDAQEDRYKRLYREQDLEINHLNAQIKYLENEIDDLRVERSEMIYCIDEQRIQITDLEDVCKELQKTTEIMAAMIWGAL